LKVNWSAQAGRDADNLWLYIAADNPDAADRVVIRIHEALAMLSEHPKAGRRGRIGKTREFVVAGTPYLVVYDVTPDEIEVRRVIHGAQDWPPKRKR
jgi:toxin ParE1/3/4